MTLDPYRTLGLEPGASSAEVKRAYRRLAKAFHPDSAGEAALPRFLAIHEAYEAIRTGRPMGATRTGAAASERGAPPTAEPWRADPARARAARERARTGRTRGGTSARPREDRAGSSGSARPSGGGASGTSGTTRGRRGGTRKATLGSTSYDEARDPADASWSGASWYGPTTGEYWIINPREYADPRKHGPEYQSRARRMAADPSVSGTIEDEAPFVSMPIDESETGGEHADRVHSDAPRGDAFAGAEAAGRDGGRGRQAFETRAAAADPGRGRARVERTRTERARTERAGTERAHPDRSAPVGSTSATERPIRPSPAGAAEAPWDPTRLRQARRRTGRFTGDAGPPQAEADRPGAGIAVADSTRGWLGVWRDDQIGRIGSALVAWPPIGLAAAAAIGELTGCTAFSATCSGTDPFLPWLAQAGILGLLLLLPVLARLLAGGTIAVLMALVPTTAFLLVVGGAGEPEAGFALAFLLGIVWILGVAGSIIVTSRRRPGDSPGRVP